MKFNVNLIGKVYLIKRALESRIGWITYPEYLKNAENEHLIGWSLPDQTNEIGLFCNPGFRLGSSIPPCLYPLNIQDLSSEGL